jgi:hypothetical protein
VGSHSHVCHVSFQKVGSLSPFSSFFGVALSNGGTAGIFWNFVIASIGLSFVYASIAELGSMYVCLQLSAQTPSLMRFPDQGFRPLAASITGLLFWPLAHTAVTSAT